MKLDWIFKGILLIVTYILIVSTGYIQLICTCPMLKAGKVQSVAISTILASLFKHYFVRVHAKMWGLFAQLCNNSIGCFVLEVTTVDTLSKF